jgi:hypothetical protein
MPLFHFDVQYDDESWSDDQEGTELADAEAARREALDLIAEMAKEKLREHQQLSVRIRDGDPEPVLILTLGLRAEERSGSVRSQPSEVPS